MTEAILKLGLYRHYKGNLYQVIGIGRHSETLEEMVLYRGLYNDYGLWARPRVSFESTVEHAGKEVLRFEYIRQLDIEAPDLR